MYSSFRNCSQFCLEKKERDEERGERGKNERKKERKNQRTEKRMEIQRREEAERKKIKLIRSRLVRHEHMN